MNRLDNMLLKLLSILKTTEGKILKNIIKH
jgi:hypothetical protein